MNYVYGAAFDPITKAHLEIIKNLYKHLKKDDTLHILVSDNDEKNYTTTLADRLYTVKNSIKAQLHEADKIVYHEQKLRMLQFLRTTFVDHNTDDFTIVVGEDEWESLCKFEWVHSKTLLSSYNFKIIPRDIVGCDAITLPAGVFTKVVESMVIKTNISGISSSAVREILFRNPFTKYADVSTFITRKTFELIKDKKLYKQNNDQYEAEEKAFLDKYKIDKEVNHWADPSNTADIVAFHDDKILLIRRGNFPYKNCWALPGGFFDKTDPELANTASRELCEETTIDIPAEKFRQIKTYSHIFDPRLRIIDTAFSVRVSAKDYKHAVGSDDASEARWFSVNDLPFMAFHHKQIIKDWLATR